MTATQDFTATETGREGQNMTEKMIAAEPPRSVLAFLREGRLADASRSKSKPRAKSKRGFTFRRLLAVALMLIIPLGAVLGLAASAQAADPDDALLTSTFYRVASNTTTLFSTVQEPGSETRFNDDWVKVLRDPGTAGSLLGYADPNITKDVGGWFSSKLSGSSDAIGYETLTLRDADGNREGVSNQGMQAYAYFGATLSGMGLDSTSTGLSLGFMSWVSGGIVMVLFILSGIVDTVFGFVLWLLDTLNPFKLFYKGVLAVFPKSSTFADGMVGGNPDDGGILAGIFSGITSWVSGWYQQIFSLSSAILLPIFLAIFLVGLLVAKKGGHGGKLKKLLIRFGFVVLGLPLIGMMYTGTISTMAEEAKSGNTGSVRVVMSTYVDFEGWVMTSRLAIPEGVTMQWDANSLQPTGATQSNVRNTVLAINNATHNLGLEQIVSSGAPNTSWSQAAIDAGEEERVSSATSSNAAYFIVMTVLQRYMENAQITAASFETASKGQLANTGYYQSTLDDNQKKVKDWFESMNDAATANPVHNPLVSVAEGSGLRAEFHKGNFIFSTQNLDSCVGRGEGIKVIRGSSGEPRGCNLSPVAMYNYLNTEFGPTSMTMYSSSNVMSSATRSIHNSVNQAGTGVMSFFYWLNAVILMGSFVLIGIGYAFSIIIANFRRTFQIVTAVPFATLGAIAAIAKVLVYSTALILEIVVTIFLYKIVQMFLITLPQLIEMPFSMVLNDENGAFAGFVKFLMSGWQFGLVVTFLSILIVILFTTMAMRSRKALVKAMEEAVTKIVEKFTETSVGGGGGGGLGKTIPAFGGGLAAGAGAAMGNRMMSNNKDPKATTDGAPKAEGPEAVSTAGGTADASTASDPQAAADTPAEGGAVTGDIGVGDGTLQVEDGTDPNSPAGGSGGPGTLALTPGDEDPAAAETAEGRRVEAQGLSDGGAGAGGTDDAAPQGPKVESDGLDSASDSLSDSAEGYAAADKKRLEAAKEGAEAAGSVAEATARGTAGDTAGAAQAAGRAAQHGGSAVAADEQAKQSEVDAGQSSLDAPDQTHANRARRAEQVSQAGGTVANAAGAVSPASGGGKGAGDAAARTASPAPSPTPAPGSPRPSGRRAARPAGQPAQAPAQAPVKPAPIAPPTSPTPARKPGPIRPAK